MGNVFFAYKRRNKVPWEGRVGETRGVPCYNGLEMTFQRHWVIALSRRLELSSLRKKRKKKRERESSLKLKNTYCRAAFPSPPLINVANLTGIYVFRVSLSRQTESLYIIIYREYEKSACEINFYYVSLECKNIVRRSRWFIHANSFGILETFRVNSAECAMHTKNWNNKINHARTHSEFFK